MKLLLHVCCAPCASYALEYLSPSYEITALFYNPNILPQEEQNKRAAEFERLLGLARYPNPVSCLDCRYTPEKFRLAAAPYVNEPEGGRRCQICFEIRLEETAIRAKSGGFDCFATTLSVSPHKNAKLLNEIGGRLGEAHGVGYLPLDLKKNNGFKRSVDLCKQYGIYRQTYCGCGY